MIATMGNGMKQELSQQPVPDRAEPNAFFPRRFR
ncbi:hypothetical protein ETAF_1848 [Edwardsiella tarda FL6-60]|uniref:Uncharacterized protein n=1 Tax=Edwardsiella tarda (strain FL6-60) TaxID=718251 RepID=A0A0H3DVH7_EDWTF|nr:hypothetical protein ETAF_1848 [Edwardsiella tarda FL6-60]